MRYFAGAASTAKHRHGLSRARPDSPGLRPLHYIPFQFRRLHFHSIAFRRPQAAETGGKRACATRRKSKGREASPGHDIGNNRESGHFPTAPLRKLRFADRKTSALTPNYRQWADTSAISLRARLRCHPCCPCRTPPDAAPVGRGVRIDGRALSRRARTNPATRTKLWLCGRTVMPDASRQPHKRYYL